MLYHSFPRPRGIPDKNPPDKGIKILENILRYGLLLAPEIIGYEGVLDVEGKKTDPVSMVQCRFCMTAIDNAELLQKHAEYFGSIHIEFTEECAYEMGAIPVIYLPEAPLDATSNSLWHLAVFFVRRLRDFNVIINKLCELDKAIHKYVDADVYKMPIDMQGREKNFDVIQLRDTLELILDGIVDTYKDRNSKNAQELKEVEFNQMLGAIEGMCSLFYPTDNIRKEGDEKFLFFFKQREWRIIANMCIAGESQDRDIYLHERKAIVAVDKDFFEKNKQNFPTVGLHPRINLCRLLPEINNKPIKDYINKIYVPQKPLVLSNELHDRVKDLALNYKVAEKIVPYADYSEILPSIGQ